MKKYSRVYAKIDLDTILYNLNQMKDHINKDTKIMAVIKMDGYGHGALPIARTIENINYIYGFAVATTEEAIELRFHGIQKPILVLGYVFPEHYIEVIKNHITPTIFNLNTALELSELAQKYKEKVSVHIKIDTGMNRIGFKDNEESIQSIKQISNLPGIKIEGIFTHFASADETDKEFTHKQLDRFQAMVSKLEERNIKIAIKHSSNSAAIIDIPEANMNLVRAGISMYGVYPSNEVNRSNISLKPALELISHVVFVKEVEKGTGISYGSTHVTNRITKVATIPVGYGDGYPRSLSSKGYVLINGNKAPILGRICMDQFMVDVTDIDSVSEGDLVTLLGKNEEADISVEELGELSNRFSYEFLCDLGKRIPRVYVIDGKLSETKDYFNLIK